MSWPNTLRGQFRLGVGAMWILSGLLMFQPLVRSPMFFTNMLAPVAEAWQPFAVQTILRGGDVLWLSHPHLWPWLIGLAQCAAGAWIILWPHRSRSYPIALYALAAWSLTVWVFGEGFGNLFNGTGSALAGTPGIALLYGICTVGLVLPRAWWESGQITRRARQGLGWMWMMMAALQALPGAGFWHGSRLAELFGLVTMDGSEPSVLQRLINAGVTTSFRAPVLVNGLLVIAMLIIGIAWIKQWRYASLLTILWVAWIWIVPQAFGAILTGLAPTPGLILPWLLIITVARQDLPRHTEPRRILQSAPPS